MLHYIFRIGDSRYVSYLLCGCIDCSDIVSRILIHTHKFKYFHNILYILIGINIIVTIYTFQACLYVYLGGTMRQDII